MGNWSKVLPYCGLITGSMLNVLEATAQEDVNSFAACLTGRASPLDKTIACPGDWSMSEDVRWIEPFPSTSNTKTFSAATETETTFASEDSLIYEGQNDISVVSTEAFGGDTITSASLDNAVVTNDRHTIKVEEINKDGKIIKRTLIHEGTVSRTYTNCDGEKVQCNASFDMISRPKNYSDAASFMAAAEQSTQVSQTQISQSSATNSKTASMIEAAAVTSSEGNATTIIETSAETLKTEAEEKVTLASASTETSTSRAYETQAAFSSQIHSIPRVKPVSIHSASYQTAEEHPRLASAKTTRRSRLRSVFKTRRSNFMRTTSAEIIHSAPAPRSYQQASFERPRVAMRGHATSGKLVRTAKARSFHVVQQNPEPKSIMACVTGRASPHDTNIRCSDAKWQMTENVVYTERFTVQLLTPQPAQVKTHSSVRAYEGTPSIDVASADTVAP